MDHSSCEYQKGNLFWSLVDPGITRVSNYINFLGLRSLPGYIRLSFSMYTIILKAILIAGARGCFQFYNMINLQTKYLNLFLDINERIKLYKNIYGFAKTVTQISAYSPKYYSLDPQ